MSALISLEGPDGSGKTTMWEMLQEDFGDGVVFTREPTETWYGDAVYRSLNSDDADSVAELFLYTADHAAHITETVQPALDRGDVVVTDRYVDSRYAYQATTLSDRFGGWKDALAFISYIHQPWTRLPDTTIFLDIPPEVSVQRSKQANKFEEVDHLSDVYRVYKHLEDECNRYKRVDATRSPAAVYADIHDIVTAAASDTE